MTAHAFFRVAQGLFSDLQMTSIETIITEIQPFFRGHYLHFWNNWFIAKLGTNPISAKMREFRIKAHALCRTAQGLSSDLQMTRIESIITEVQSFSREHFLHFWNNWFLAKLGTNPISAQLREFRMTAHALCRAPQGLSSDLKLTWIQSIITEIQPFTRGHFLHFWNNWFIAKHGTNPISVKMRE